MKGNTPFMVAAAELLGSLSKEGQQ